MRKRPKTAEAYARYLYMAADCNGVVQAPMTDTAIVEARVRAFMDGARWQRRRTKRDAVNGRGES